MLTYDLEYIFVYCISLETCVYGPFFNHIVFLLLIFKVFFYILDNNSLLVLCKYFLPVCDLPSVYFLRFNSSTNQAFHKARPCLTCLSPHIPGWNSWLKLFVSPPHPSMLCASWGLGKYLPLSYSYLTHMDMNKGLCEWSFNFWLWLLPTKEITYFRDSLYGREKERNVI